MGYPDSVAQPWQATVCRALHDAARRAIPDAAERLQYGKPHYLRNGKYAAAIGTAKGWVTLTVFNAAGIDGPAGLFEPGPPERKTITIGEGQAVDYDRIAALLGQAASTL